MRGKSARATCQEQRNRSVIFGCSHRQLFACVISLLALFGCSNPTARVPVRPVAAIDTTPPSVRASTALANEKPTAPIGGGVFKVGKPYRIKGRWYHPRHQPSYDELGMASWYGTDFHGKRTANGEIYNMDALTAAHPTLPLPSLVHVTNMENGRTMVVRVNDRGPYSRNRIIDLSRRTADLLGFRKNGTARVRVKYLRRAPLSGDDSFERSHLAQQSWFQKRHAAALSQPPLIRKESTILTQDVKSLSTPRGRYVIRVGTFRDHTNAKRLSQSLDVVGPVRVERVLRGSMPLYRVYVGPYNRSEMAQQALNNVKLAGANDAMIIAR